MNITNQNTERMTEKDILEGNKLIAEFMGFERITGKYYEGFKDKDGKYTFPAWRDINEYVVDKRTQLADYELSFHKKWDWLKPVVEKIGDIEFSSVKGMREWMNVNFRESEIHIYCKIDVVYNAVVNFIKWYNDAPNRENELKNKRELGFYWVSKKGTNDWVIAQFIEGGYWLLMGDDSIYSNEDFCDFEISENKIIRQL